MNMVIFYLQCIDFVPNLQCPKLMQKAGLRRNPSVYWHNVNHLDTFYMTFEQSKQGWKRPEHFDSHPMRNVALLYGFFQFYISTFKRQSCMVSIKRGKDTVLPKTSFHRCKLFFTIEDPFETFDSNCPHDLGMPVEKPNCHKILSCLEASEKHLREFLLQYDNPTLDVRCLGPTYLAIQPGYQGGKTRNKSTKESDGNYWSNGRLKKGKQTHAQLKLANTTDAQNKPGQAASYNPIDKKENRRKQTQTHTKEPVHPTPKDNEAVMWPKLSNGSNQDEKVDIQSNQQPGTHDVVRQSSWVNKTAQGTFKMMERTPPPQQLLAPLPGYGRMHCMVPSNPHLYWNPVSVPNGYPGNSHQGNVRVPVLHQVSSGFPGEPRFDSALSSHMHRAPENQIYVQGPSQQNLFGGFPGHPNNGQPHPQMKAFQKLERLVPQRPQRGIQPINNNLGSFGSVGATSATG